LTPTIPSEKLLYIPLLAVLSALPFGASAQTTTTDAPASTTATQTATPAAPAAIPAVTAAAAAPSLAISAPAAAPEPVFLREKKYSVSGIVDGYYNYDNNDPTPGNTQLRNFDIRADQVSLTEGKVVLAYDPAPFGISADIGLGSAFELMHPSNPSGGGL
jgi:hypothetical protein